LLLLALFGLDLELDLLALRMFLFGMCGSIAVEIVKVVAIYERGQGKFPARYRRWGFWVARLLLAAIGGALAVGYGVDAPLVAVHVGASVPVIIESLARTPPKEQAPP
jgi:hypothetical protein